MLIEMSGPQAAINAFLPIATYILGGILGFFAGYWKGRAVERRLVMKEELMRGIGGFKR